MIINGLFFLGEKPYYFFPVVVKAISCYKTGSLSNISAVLTKMQQNGRMTVHLYVILSGDTLYCYVDANAFSMAAVLLGTLYTLLLHLQPHPESNTQW